MTEAQNVGPQDHGAVIAYVQAKIAEDNTAQHHGCEERREDQVEQIKQDHLRIQEVLLSLRSLQRVLDLNLSLKAGAEKDVESAAKDASVKERDLYPEPDVELALLIGLCERIDLFFVDPVLTNTRDQKD